MRVSKVGRSVQCLGDLTAVSVVVGLFECYNFEVDFLTSKCLLLGECEVCMASYGLHFFLSIYENKEGKKRGSIIVWSV